MSEPRPEIVAPRRESPPLDDWRSGRKGDPLFTALQPRRVKAWRPIDIKREAVEAKIEELITLLDAFDAPMEDREIEADMEDDDGVDDEPDAEDSDDVDGEPNGDFNPDHWPD